MRLLWMTDIHLDHCSPKTEIKLYEDIKAHEPDGVLITGDIGHAHSFARYLLKMRLAIGPDIYFVLGNHDFWGGDEGKFPSVEETRQVASDLLPHHICYLGYCGPVRLSETAALVGHDGWYDGRYEPMARSSVQVWDEELVQGLRHNPRCLREQTCEQWADAAAAYMRKRIDEAIALGESKIVVATHVPPFPEAAVYQAKPSNRDWIPWMTSKATGDMLIDEAEAHRNVEFLVLCGHSHGENSFRKRSNLRVVTGGAEYKQPKVAAIWDL